MSSGRRRGTARWCEGNQGNALWGFKAVPRRRGGREPGSRIALLCSALLTRPALLKYSPTSAIHGYPLTFTNTQLTRTHPACHLKALLVPCPALPPLSGQAALCQTTRQHLGREVVRGTDRRHLFIIVRAAAKRPLDPELQEQRKRLGR